MIEIFVVIFILSIIAYHLQNQGEYKDNRTPLSPENDDGDPDKFLDSFIWQDDEWEDWED
jgi:hypothetical protein